MKYETIAADLRRRIAAMQIGDQLPTEATLAEQFNTSNLTVRQAMDELAMDGLVRRLRGTGTFVNSPERVAAADLVEVLTAATRAGGKLLIRLPDGNFRRIEIT